MTVEAVDSTISQDGGGPVLAVERSEQFEKRRDTRRIPIGFAEEVDAREKAERVPKRRYFPFEKILSEAAGDRVWTLNAHENGWEIGGKPFNIARYYHTRKVAFDFADSLQDEQEAPARKALLKAQGIIHVFFAMKAEMDKDQIKDEIARQRAEEMK